MPSRQTQATHKDIEPLKPSKSNRGFSQQHGPHANRVSLLLDVPSETLTGITSYLEPPSLLSVGRVNNSLHEHIKNDNTWHRAFVCQFLGIGPECEINDNVKCLMLRRSENSWRNEFCTRYRLRRRWERSRNATITHIPVHSPISGTHIMPRHSLLSSSLQYGIIARSYPLTGKILSGFLDASGTRTGLGIGNPNAEFSPDVTTCVFTSDGGTAKVFWGYRNGEVAVTTASRIMDIGRRTDADSIRCSVDDQHAGAVLDAVWDEIPNAMAVTAGADGLVKVWDAKKVQCLWTSTKNTKNLVPDACIKVSAAFNRGYIVGALRSGDVIVWSDLNPESPDSSMLNFAHETRISHAELAMNQDGNTFRSYDTIILRADAHAIFPTILVTYPDDPYFFRIRIGEANKIEVTTFGDPSFGPIATLSPFFSSGSSFVLVGDHLGSVSVYDWHAVHPAYRTLVHHVRNFEAHEDGSSVTALAWNGVTLITGSARGAMEVWDGLTFKHLRSFVSLVPRVRGRSAASQGEQRDKEAVTRILIGPEKEVLVASIGDRILAWKAGPVTGIGGGLKGRHSTGEAKRKKGQGIAKYINQLEMHQTINESRNLLKLESAQVKQKNGRERAQQARLESMGLDEAEVVDYLLMLSHDEAMHETNKRSATMSYLPTGTEGGVIEGDFDEISSTAFASSSQNTLSVDIASRPEQKPPLQDWKTPTAESSRSASTSFRNDLDTMQGSISPRSSLPKKTGTTPIGASTSSTRNSIPINAAVARRSNTSRSAGSASPRSVQSAWNMPLAESIRNPPRVSPTRRAAVPSTRALQNRESPPVRGAPSLEEMDEDMRFAIELSLAEARSRGEDV
ncbi:WD40-repeat-containing domain protein [Collybia nuda]|uniref:WD40-repeat-containing domain protein n=1 Tax=Collybia nuda TaxID=64659 RepID=A0A9P5Y7Y4_9AGAR|nr:WD40-repeat-containing domain protein [Collybia nuda]